MDTRRVTRSVSRAARAPLVEGLTPARHRKAANPTPLTDVTNRIDFQPEEPMAKPSALSFESIVVEKPSSMEPQIADAVIESQESSIEQEVMVDAAPAPAPTPAVEVVEQTPIVMEEAPIVAEEATVVIQPAPMVVSEVVQDTLSEDFQKVAEEVVDIMAQIDAADATSQIVIQPAAQVRSKGPQKIKFVEDEETHELIAVPCEVKPIVASPDDLLAQLNSLSLASTHTESEYQENEAVPVHVRFVETESDELEAVAVPSEALLLKPFQAYASDILAEANTNLSFSSDIGNTSYMSAADDAESDLDTSFTVSHDVYVDDLNERPQRMLEPSEQKILDLQHKQQQQQLLTQTSELARQRAAGVFPAGSLQNPSAPKQHLFFEVPEVSKKSGYLPVGFIQSTIQAEPKANQHIRFDDDEAKN